MKGFTLVELSIVLVIIGLLIGGILVGQSLINSAKINAAVKQLSQYDIAIATFILKYKQLPGDSDKFPNGGNKNGQVTLYEVGKVWNHLSLGVGLKNSKNTDFVVYDPYGGAGTITEAGCPRFKLDQRVDPGVANDLGIPCLQIIWSVWPYGPVTGLYQYRNGGDSFTPTTAPLKPQDALALDQKMDNGLPGNGVGAGGADAGKIFSYTAGIGGTCVSGGKYDVTVSDYTCMLDMQVGVTNGINGK